MNAPHHNSGTPFVAALVLLGGLIFCHPGLAMNGASTANSSGTASGSIAFVEEEPAKDVQKPKLIISPELGQCTLEIGRQVLKPIHTASPSYREQRVGDHRIRFVKDQVFAIRASDGKEVWSAKDTDGQHLHWLTHDGDTACLLGYEVNEEGRWKAMFVKAKRKSWFKNLLKKATNGWVNASHRGFRY